MSIKEVPSCTSLLASIRIERSVNGYLFGLVTNRIEVAPSARSQLPEPLWKPCYPSAFGIVNRHTYREVESSENGSGLSCFGLQILNKRIQVADRLRFRSSVPPIRSQLDSGAPPLARAATPISMVDERGFIHDCIVNAVTVQQLPLAKDAEAVAR